MTAPLDFETLLESVLEERGPHSAPEATILAGLSRARGVSQARPRVRASDRRAWPAPRLSIADPSVARLALVGVVTLLTVALLTAAIGVGGWARSQTGRADFVRPFTYTWPTDARVRLTNDAKGPLVAWELADSDVPSDHPGDDGILGQLPQPGDRAGVIVASAETAWSHSDDGRFALPAEPHALLTALRERAHVPLGQISEVSVDGRAAVRAGLDGTGGYDVHITGSMQGLVNGEFVRLDLPAQLTVVEIGDTTVLILVWARTATELAAWLPVAGRFVDSLDFDPNTPS